MYLSVITDHLVVIQKKSFLFLVLLGIAFFILGLIDQNFWQSQLSNSLSSSIDPRLYLVLLGFPHIFASLTTFSLKGHLSSYPKKDFIALFMLILLCIGLYAISKILFSSIFLILLSSHISGQSIGILSYWMKENLLLKKVWLWLNTLMLMIGFINIYTGDLKFYLIKYFGVAMISGWVLANLATIIALILIVKTPGKENKFLILATQINLFGMFYFPIYSNVLFGLILLIINHDLSAFYFYINHRYNITFSFFNCSVMIAVSLLLAFAAVSIATHIGFPQAIIFFQVMHYLVEKKIWKRNSHHRKWVQVADA